MKSEIAKHLKELKSKLKKTNLIAVTKYSPVEDIVTAYEAGQYEFGENRVQDLEEKANYFKEKEMTKVKWHMIGHLQTNKVKDLLKIPNLYAIHSVDSLRLLEELLKRENEFKGKELKIFFQINTSHEGEKTGFESLDDLKLAIELLLNRPDSKLKVYGLMTMGTIRTENFETEAERCFRDLVNVRDSLLKAYKLKELKLSMGMSQDFEIALKYGADFVRIGSLIFK